MAAIKPEDIGDLPLKPFQPMHFAFPSRFFGKSAPVNRSFQPTWFNRYPWLHYVVAQDAARCFTCCKAVKDGRAMATCATERAYLVKGFSNWKDSTQSFSKHKSYDFHKGMCCCTCFYCRCRGHAVTTSCHRQARKP